VDRSIRRSDHPSRPSATTCSFSFLLKTLLIPAMITSPRKRPERLPVVAGFQVSISGRIWVSTEAFGPQ
jgi:hypothetical protein